MPKIPSTLSLLVRSFLLAGLFLFALEGPLWGQKQKTQKKPVVGKVAIWLIQKAMPATPDGTLTFVIQKLEVLQGAKKTVIPMPAEKIEVKKLKGLGKKLGAADLRPGKYTGLRIFISEASRHVQGKSEPIPFPEELKKNGLTVSKPFSVYANDLTNLVLKIDPKNFSLKMGVFEGLRPAAAQLKKAPLKAGKKNRIQAQLKKAVQFQQKGMFKELKALLDSMRADIQTTILSFSNILCPRDSAEEGVNGCWDDSAFLPLFFIGNFFEGFHDAICELIPSLNCDDEETDYCPDCPKLSWDETPLNGSDLGTTTEPALLVTNGRAYLAVVGIDGHVYVTERDVREQASWGGGCWSLTQDWGAWSDPVTMAPNPSFHTHTPPVFVERRRNNQIYLFARGDDDNLYFSKKSPGGSWSDWAALTGDGSVVGRIDAAATAAQPNNVPDEIHVAFHSTLFGLSRLVLRNGDTDVDRFNYAAPALEGSGFTPSLATDGGDRVVLAIAFPGMDLSLPRFAVFKRESDFESMTTQVVGSAPPFLTGAAWTGKSDVVYTKDGDFLGVFGAESVFGNVHVPYILRAEETIPLGNEWAYLGWAADIPPALVDYRNKVFLAATGSSHDIYFLRRDNTERISSPGFGDNFSPWFYEEPKEALKSDFRTAMDTDGSELFAAIADQEGAVRFVLLSRSLSYKRILNQQMVLGYADQDDDGDSDPGCFTKPAWEIPSATEIGFGTWTTPEWMTGHLMADYIDTAVAGDPDNPVWTLGGYPVWIHAAANLSNAYFGGGIHIDPGMNYYPWLEEYYHKVAQALAISSSCPGDGYTCGYGEELEPGISQTAIENARDLFSDRVGCCQGDASRAAGFVGAGGGAQENYDSNSDEHSFLYVLLWYFNKPQVVQGAVTQDTEAGDTLLKDKYDWIKNNIYKGVEFEDENIVQP